MMPLFHNAGLRMEDPMLPVPRFTPTVRKFRPQPINLMDGLKKVKVPLTSSQSSLASIHALNMKLMHDCHILIMEVGFKF